MPEFSRAAGALGFERDKTSDGSARGRRVEVGDRHAEPGQILQREVDPTGPPILGDVLAVLDDLQRGADPIGELGPLGRACVEHLEHDPADRVRRQLAVFDQVLVRRVGLDLLVDEVRLDQVVERLVRQVLGPHAHRETPQDGRVGLGAASAQILARSARKSRSSAVRSPGAWSPRSSMTRATS